MKLIRTPIKTRNLLVVDLRSAKYRQRVVTNKKKAAEKHPQKVWREFV